MDVAQAILSRRSIKTFDPDHEIDDATLQEIFELTTRAPSSFNLQHWRFVVVRDQQRKDRLRDASYGQRHVGEASAVIVVAAKLDAHEDADSVQQHVPDEKQRQSVVDMIQRFYAKNPQFQRDEAIRSASLAAMTLMLVAQAKGLATCPMIGFDAQKVTAIVELPDSCFPVMLVVLGKPGEGEPFPTSRLPLPQVVKLETSDGLGLGARKP
ncbi:MAG: nitroreductase family protein [Planctomycetota bacterium]|jgi:nitroreductase